MNQVAAAPAFSMSFDEVAEIKRRILPGRDYADRVSLALLLRSFIVNPGEDLYVFDELDALDGRKSVSITKEEEPFRCAPLIGFFHKHFYSPRHLTRNIGIRWGLPQGGRTRDLDLLIRQVALEHGHDPDVWPKKLAYEFVLGGYEARVRDRRLTGDWIIFAKWDSKNYYLDLATHEEGNNGDELFRKLKQGCEVEFPFLFP